MRIMDALKRFLGIAGDNTRRAIAIAVVADESTKKSRELNEHLAVYANADDPLETMIIDLHNKRAANRMASKEWHEGR